MEKDPIPITEPITDHCSMDADMCCAVSDEEHSTDDDSYEDQDRSDAVDDKEHSAQEYESESNEELNSSMVCVDEYFKYFFQQSHM